MVELDLQDIRTIIHQSLAIIKSEPMLLKLKAPVVIGTDIHGQYYDLLRFFNDAG
jgi:serine/threonine-protein phosphatase PP1 catalytic subunit